MRTRLLYLALAVVSCSDSTGPNSMLLVDGTGASVTRGALRISSTTVLLSGGEGTVSRLVYTNISTKDTTVVGGTCGPDLRLYVSTTATQDVYDPRNGMVCTLAAIIRTVKPGEAVADSTILYGATVGSKIGVGRYYLRFRSFDSQATELPAGVIDLK
jgi:hypothetical protein